MSLCCSISRLAAKTHFPGQILLQKDTEVCNTVRWQSVLEGSHAVSGFMVILGHLYTVEQYRPLRVGNCPSTHHLATAQTWASWLKLAWTTVHQQHVCSACYHVVTNGLPSGVPFPFLTHCSQSFMFSISWQRQTFGNVRKRNNIFLIIKSQK